MTGKILCLALLASATAGRTQTSDLQAVSPPKLLQHEVAVTVKLIQVYVTDKKGKPVRDLTKEDFIVRDNGRDMVLTEFEKHVIEAVPPKSRPAIAEEKVIATPTPPATILNRKFILFFDFAFNNARGINKAKEAALHFVGTELIPGDEVGLLSYSMLKGLVLHEYLSLDHKKISEAIGDFGAKDSAGRAENFEDEYWRRASWGAGEIYAKSRFQLESERKESKYQVQNFILKVTDLAKAFRYVPGKKNLVLFSTGIATSLIYYGQAGAPTGGNAPLKNVDAGDFTLRTQYEEMMKELSAADCSIFAFDTREATMVASLFDSDAQSFEDHSRILSNVDGARVPMNVFKDDKTTGFYTLNRLAGLTGGKYYSNIEEYRKNLGEMQNLTGSYYVLGYPVNETGDGKFHEIKVEAKRKGVEVRAQSGYFDPKPFAEYSDLEKQLQLYDLALSDRPRIQTPLAVPLTGLACSAGWRPRFFLLAKIPNDVIEQFAGGKVEFVALAFDGKENLAGFQRIEVDLTKYKGMDVFHTSAFSLPPGSYRCRLVIRDLENGKSAVGSVLVNFAPPPLTGMGLQSPLLLVQGSNFLYIESEATKADAIDWKAAYPYNRAQYSPLLGELSAGTTKLYALAPCSFSGLASPEIILTAWLIETATGTRIPLAGSILDRALNAGGEFIFAELPMANVAAGRYRLYLHAADSASKAVAYTQTSLVIK